MDDEHVYEKLTGFISDIVEIFNLLYHFSSTSSNKSGEWLATSSTLAGDKVSSSPPGDSL